MKKLLIFSFLAGTICFAQSPQRNSYPGHVQGDVFTIPNTAGSQAASFEYVMTPTPAAVSISIAGCMRGTNGQPGAVGTCDSAAETYASTANSVRAPTFSKVYDTFQITVTTLTAGSTLTVNTTIVVSKVGTSSGGGGAGTPSAPANSVQFNNGGAFGGTSGLTTDAVGNFTLAQGSLAASTPAFSQTGTWNAGAVAFTNWISNITCTASATASIAAGWGVGGTQWQLRYGGANCASPFMAFPVGTATNPSLANVANATGINFPNSSQVCLDGGGNYSLCDISGGGIQAPSTGFYDFTATGLPTGATGTKDTGIARTAAGVLSVDDGTPRSENGIVRAANGCRVTADITLPVNTATTVCTWSLPAVAKAWAWQCEIPWVISAGTGTNTLAIIANASQTPTGATNGFAEISTTNTNTGTEATTAISASGATTLLTSGTITPAATVFGSRTSGTLLASATAGTFAIQMTAAGTTATAAAKAGATCMIY